jgi:2-amino-4-hydroxy-6-hydroxymethyldihydropteridine diphosphokinase
MMLLGVGTNLGNKVQNLYFAYELIEKYIGNILNHSYVYRSQAWGYQSNNEFLNTVVEVETPLIPYHVLSFIKKIEEYFNRERPIEQIYADRYIDIDILFCNSLIISDLNLTIPHPLLHKRLFTMLPLYELYPDFVHPVFNIPISQLISFCDDTSKITQTPTKIWYQQTTKNI